MKKLLVITLVLFSFCNSVLNGQNTVITDANFENYLETHSADGTEVDLGDAESMGDGIANNGLVPTNKINDVITLDVSDLAITDLTGIEGFIALENLFISNNDIAAIDISNNVNLVSFLCGGNSLNALNVSANTNLETLNFADNQIQNIDLSNSLALKSLTASENQLADIDVTNNLELNTLNISNNRIEGELLVNTNVHLESLFCASNQITVVDLSANTLLRNLDISNNQVQSLDLSALNSVVCPDPQTDPVTNCQGSSTINVSRNQLSSLIIANSFNDLISFCNASENPDLFCVQIDEGFTVPNSWLKDDWTYYSANTCVDIYTYVPDDNFEQALITLGYDDVLDNLVLTDNITSVTNLDVSNEAISSLVGIEDFTALETLNCSTNTIESVDLSANTSLLQISISNNDLSSLDLSSNTVLSALFCGNNFIESLDLSSNSALTMLNCSSNALTSLNLENNTLLNEVDCSFNILERLDLTNNGALERILCNDNNLFALGINNGNNAAIITFDATNNNNLSCIEVDEVAQANAAMDWQKDAEANYNLECGTYVPDDNFEQALIDQGIDSDGVLNNFVPTADVSGVSVLNISGLAIADLTGIEDFLSLEDFNCANNSVAHLDLSTNTALQSIDCSNNLIKALDLTLNISLIALLCNNNALKLLNIQNGNNNLLATFNATNNPTLFCINADDAIIGNIPANWQKDTIADYNSDCLNNRFTSIPDPLFEQALIDLGYDDVLDSQVLTSNIEQVRILNVSDRSIEDLTGILDFKALEELDCSNNLLESLNVSNLMLLQRLNCSSNYLLTNNVNDPNGLLNTTGTQSLIELFCADNNLSDLNTSQNVVLELLDCSGNNLDMLDISGNFQLRLLNCSNNDLTSLDISNNQALEDVNCNSNQLDILDTSTTNNTSLTDCSCSNNSLQSLDISSYSALVNLNCSSNELSQLNISNNIALKSLTVTSNEISEISLVNNVDLVDLQIAQNSLATLNLNSNILLEFLDCDFNAIAQLDISLNTLLKSLSCSNNELSVIDLSNTANLIAIDASFNVLSDLVLPSDLSVLKTLNLSNNQLEGDLDLTTMATSACVFEQNQTEFCPETITVNVSNNLFSFINIQNGNNAEVANFNASSNPNLECIQVDNVNNVPINWIKDDTTSYNEDCNFGETFVPDDNFEQALIDLGLDSGPLNDYVLTANIDGLTTLNISGNTIADLTGIEDFIALETLDCSLNLITEVDFSSNLSLTDLDCSNNQIANLDVSNNQNLVVLNCANNTLIDLDLSENSDLVDLNISNNSFLSFSPSDVLSLQVFNCNANPITELDFQPNQNLTSISCQSNMLEVLNIRNGQNNILTNLDATDNPNLICIETDTGTVPSGANWSIDATAQFAVACFFGQTFVPDDNFEQALIDLGFDAAPLDDYVFTENIQDIEFLNINSREISDLTGIEDFIALASLNASNNLIISIDFSDNHLLSNLDVSSNLIEAIDVSFLTNLSTLDVAGNSLTELNVSANNNLVNLDLSNNGITTIDVSNLFNLVDFSCAFNQINSLDLTQNPNLNLVFCQSNALLGDQLNIQNGNNENLQVFNGTNNPNLGCILVDDPVAVITNTDGTYDNWDKDPSTSYQIICEDADNDGVPNDIDLCPGTEFGAQVDLFGCAIIDLPVDNFRITINGETCLNSNNGQITIVAQEAYSYTVSLFSEDFIEETGEDFYDEYNFTNDVDIFNLLAGSYEMCITIEEWPDYQSCYTIIIAQPDPLAVFSNRLAADALSVNLFGSNFYNIEFNNESFTTSSSSLTLALQNGLNSLKVSTDLDCQGVYEEQILVTDNFMVFPNPFNNTISINNGVKNEAVEVEIYSVFGQLVLRKTLINTGFVMDFDTSSIATGMYLIKVESESMSSIQKIMKR